MADYIKRNDLFVLSIDYSRNGEWEEAVPVRAIRNIPSANVAPIKHGKWVNGECSECGGDAPFWSMATTYYRSNFCPDCGAKMDKEQTNG